MSPKKRGEAAVNLWMLLLATVVTGGAGIAMFLVLAVPRRRVPRPTAMPARSATVHAMPIRSKVLRRS
jgi:hypothetical protein